MESVEKVKNLKDLRAEDFRLKTVDAPVRCNLEVLKTCYKWFLYTRGQTPEPLRSLPIILTWINELEEYWADAVIEAFRRLLDKPEVGAWDLSVAKIREFARIYQSAYNNKYLPKIEEAPLSEERMKKNEENAKKVFERLKEMFGGEDDDKTKSLAG